MVGRGDDLVTDLRHQPVDRCVGLLPKVARDWRTGFLPCLEVLTAQLGPLPLILTCPCAAWAVCPSLSDLPGLNPITRLLSGLSVHIGREKNFTKSIGSER